MEIECVRFVFVIYRYISFKQRSLLMESGWSTLLRVRFTQLVCATQSVSIFYLVYYFIQYPRGRCTRDRGRAAWLSTLHTFHSFNMILHLKFDPTDSLHTQNRVHNRLKRCAKFNELGRTMKTQSGFHNSVNAERIGRISGISRNS